MKKNFITLIALLVMLSTFGAGLIASPCLGAEAQAYAESEINRYPQPGITVSATGKVKAQPDIAYINFCVETKNTNLETAQAENSEKTTNLITALKSQNLDEENIKTTGYQIYPEYDYSTGYKFVGYKVSNSVRVQTKDIGNIGKIIDAGTTDGANIIRGIEFSLEDYNQSYNAALEKAVLLAKDKAMMFAKSLMATDIKIVSVKESPANSFYGIESISFAKNFDGLASTATTILHGDLDISASVELKFDFVFADDIIAENEKTNSTPF